MRFGKKLSVFLSVLHPANIAVELIELYKLFLSPYFGNNCRFYPTCSSYAIEAFRKKGFIRGFLLTVWRILRCNPFCKGGYDPVK